MARQERKGAFGIIGVLIAVFGASAFVAEESAVKVEDLVPELGRPQSAADALPSNVRIGDLADSLRVDTVRSLGSDGSAHYWVSRAGSGDLCLLLQMEGEAELFAASCGPLTAFNKQGIGLVARQGGQAQNKSVQAHLLPSDVDTSSVSKRKVAGVKSNLLVVGGTNDSRKLVPAELPRANGNTFVFAPLAEDLGRPR